MRRYPRAGEQIELKLMRGRSVCLVVRNDMPERYVSRALIVWSEHKEYVGKYSYLNKHTAWKYA